MKKTHREKEERERKNAHKQIKLIVGYGIYSTDNVMCCVGYFKLFMLCRQPENGRKTSMITLELKTHEIQMEAAKICVNSSDVSVCMFLRFFYLYCQWP